MQLLSPREQLVLGFVASIYLHRLKTGEEIVQAKNFAEENKLPPRYLETSLQRLVHAKVLKGHRGPKGGYSLAKTGLETKVLDVLDAVAEEPDPNHPAVCPLTLKGVAPAIESMAHSFRFQLGQTSIAAFVTAMTGKLQS